MGGYRNSSVARVVVGLSLAIGLTIFGGAPPALAGVGRTFVAHNGLDGNTATNCAETSPCQTFAAAYTVTNPGGEIVALDSAGYGPLTITNSVSIIAVQRAFVKPTPSSTGITINAGAGHTVLLDNIEINGAGSEAIDAWDPDIGLFQGLGMVFAKQKRLFAIGAAMRRRGARPVGLLQLARFHRRQQRLIALYPPSN